MVFDIDHFKRINDTFGHLCGDFVLKRLTRICRRRLRPEQVFARMGGDEFAILSPETTIEGVEILAERLRSSVSDHRFETDMVADSFQITCSFGCAEMNPAMTSEKRPLRGRRQGALRREEGRAESGGDWRNVSGIEHRVSAIATRSAL